MLVICCKGVVFPQAQETASLSSNASDGIVDKQPSKSQSNPFLYPSPTAANVDMKGTYEQLTSSVAIRGFRQME